MASENSKMASFGPGRKGKQRDETHRFLCTSVPCAFCGRGGNCLLLSCQRCTGKALSVHKATKRPRPKCEIRTQMPSLPIIAPAAHSRTHKTNHACMHILKHHSKSNTCTKWSLGCRIIWMRPLNITSDSEYWIVFLLDVLNIKAHNTRYPCFWKACFHSQGNW